MGEANTAVPGDPTFDVQAPEMWTIHSFVRTVLCRPDLARYADGSTYKVDAAAQSIANQNSLCVPSSLCQAAASSYPGGAFCTSGS